MYNLIKNYETLNKIIHPDFYGNFNQKRVTIYFSKQDIYLLEK